MPFVAPIVEGQGEVEALPILLHRIVAHLGHPASAQRQPLIVNPPIRVKSGSFLNDLTYFSKHVTLAAERAKQRGGSVLILLDCEDDCPARLGPLLLAKAKEVRDDVPFLVVLAYREFETWFVAAAASLRGHFGLPADLVAPPAPESRRGAKEWLGSRMADGYDPITHQHRLARLFDLDEAATNHSFRRFLDRIPSLLGS